MPCSTSFASSTRCARCCPATTRGRQDAGEFLLTTNKGFWRIDPKTKAVTQVKGTIEAKGKKDTVGTFLELEPVSGGRLIGSGHPDNQNTLPQFLGFIESEDNGKSWRVLSRLGDADLH